MLYNIGTIAINGNTATGTGTNWTAPASQVRAGQTIIVMSNPVQLFQISSVNSATSLTVTPAASPALSGQKYGILVSDIISVDGLAQAMSQLIKEYEENIGAWEIFATTSANQTITVTINGAAVNIPGIGGLARKGSNSDITELKGLSTALSIQQGGTGKKNKDEARMALSAASSGDNTDITSLGGLTTALSIQQGGTGGKTAAEARNKIGAASSGDNSDITGMTGITASLSGAGGQPTGGIITNKVTNSSSTSYVAKGMTVTYGTGAWTMYATFGALLDGSGSPGSCGPYIGTYDSNNFGTFWYFLQGSGVIRTNSGSLTPAVSDIRVKNEKQIVQEDEAVSFIRDWESIFYTLKWSPDKVRIGFRAQDIYARNPALIERIPLSDGEGGMLEDGMTVDVAEVATGYLVPVVRKLLREVAELRAKIEHLEGS